MFELLVYLFENYIETDVRADEQTLTRELSAAGFDSDDISRAFSWFSDLATLADQASPTAAADRAAYRIYTQEESKKIGHDSRSFLLFLEQANVLNPLEREVVIDRLMALPESEVELDQTKWISLMVLWRHGKARVYLFIEDALFSNVRPTIH
jgi:Smg protein